MPVHPLAGKPAPRDLLINVPRLVPAYYTCIPTRPSRRTQVAFGTSGHRGSSLSHSFNEEHILAISQAICEYRASAGDDRPALRRHGHARAVRAGADAPPSRSSPPTASR